MRHPRRGLRENATCQRSIESKASTGIGAVTLLLIALACCSPAAAVTVNWPSDAGWTVLTRAGVPYSDPHGDVNPGSNHLDVVGDSTYPGGFIYKSDPTHLMLRMRLDDISGNPANTEVYQFLLDMDGDCLIDWSLQLDLQFDDQLEFVEATNGGPNFGPGSPATTVVLTPTQSWNDGNDPGFQRLLVTSDGYNFHTGTLVGDDYWRDLAMPWSDFESITGFPRTTPFRVAITTSHSHVEISASPSADRPADTVCDSLSDPPGGGGPVPEPLTLLGLTFGVGAVGLRIRRRIVR